MQALHAVVASASGSTTVTFLREPPWETIASGRPSSAAITWAERRASRRRPSPTALTISIPVSDVTSAKPRSSATMPSIAWRSSIVTETLTSEVVTTSTGVSKRSNTSNTRRRKP